MQTGEKMGRKSIAKERRIQIIEAFYRCAVKDGQAAASIRNIAREAGVQPSVLHHYFKGRHEIIEESVVYFTDMIFTDFHQQMKALTGAEERLAKGMEFIFSKGMINNDYTGFFLECCVAARNNAKVKKTIAELFRQFQSAIIDHLQRLDHFSAMAKKDQQMLATMIVGLHEGIELQWFAEPGRVNLREVLNATHDLIRSYIRMKIKDCEPEPAT